MGTFLAAMCVLATFWSQLNSGFSQVMRIRHDAYAEAHSVQVVEPKSDQDESKHLHPKELGCLSAKE